MQTGISLYPGLENTLEENLKLINKAAALGVTRLFTSLHLPESNPDELRQQLEPLLSTARKLKLDVAADISPQTGKILGLTELNPQAFLDLGVTTVRFDSGYDLDQLSEFTQTLRVQLNASTITADQLEELKAHQANFHHLDALHNFYPRPHTGLGEEFFTAQNHLLHRFGISVGAFIACASTKSRRGPLREGLPTLEDDRHLPVGLAARHLAALGLDSLFLGDARPTDKELQKLTSLTDQTVVLKAHLLNRSPWVKDLLSRTFTARPDQARDAIRAQESRSFLAGRLIEPDSSINLERQPGDITLDNKDYLRYMGELQILTSEQEADERSNIIARVPREELFLLKYITPGRAYRFRLLD